MPPSPSDNRKTSPVGSKETLREIARANLKGLKEEDSKRSSALLAQKLADFISHRFVNARRIATFSALPHEPDLSLLHSFLPQAQLFYPLVLDQAEMTFHLVTQPSFLKKGAFGIKEPDPQVNPPALSEDLDLILVPGLSFDLQGNRLGHGHGYYDRFLSQIPNTPTVGISYSSQLRHEIPSETHDRPVAFLATEHGVIPA